MKLTKSETNNAIVTTLANVRKHPNADRIKLATVLGTQIIVGLDAKDGDVVVYFDSNLALSPEFLHFNNLYENPEMNSDPRVKGYFGKNGRIRTIKLRDEISNGFVVGLEVIDHFAVCVGLVDNVQRTFPSYSLKVGDEFTHIGWSEVSAEVCHKYIVEKSKGVYLGGSKKKKRKLRLLKKFYLKLLSLFQSRITTDSFWKHWDTKQLMREAHRIIPGMIYIEEKVHGTSGRIANVRHVEKRGLLQLWKPKTKIFWKVVSGTRRRDGTQGHMGKERREIEEKLAPHLHKGEELYYEIYGYQQSGRWIQKHYPYGCTRDGFGGEYKVMLYRVTLTTEDGYRVDLDREQVYRRAEELGLEKPYLITKYELGEAEPENKFVYWDMMVKDFGYCEGQSNLDPNTLLEGVVVWFKDCTGNWTCLKHKSEEFLLRESKMKDEGIGDVEDEL